MSNPNPTATPNPTFIGMPKFPVMAKQALKNTQQRRNLQFATHTIREKRARVVAEVPEWETLRRNGADTKDEILANMDGYLEQLEENLTKRGMTVHWARNAEEASSIVLGLVQEQGVDEVVKVKTMVSEEIELNKTLAEAGIHAWETDLAELIVQLGGDRPSHILVPAIHRGRAEVREIFRNQMGRNGRPAPDDMSEQPAELAEAARLHLREKFLRAKVAISGANFAIAETGTLVVLESEGNGRMCLTLPETLISVVGIEKMLPRFADLGTFLQLLPRSSTGERMNPYTTMWTGPTPGDGPQNMHVVLVDNGRTHVLADEVGRQALRCIRCSACLNVCPVYERAGGHAYGSVYPGPIGAILSPQLRGTTSAIDQSLPYASSLCGACFEVCPVRIDIPRILVRLRTQVVDEHRDGKPTAESAAMQAAAWMFAGSGRLEKAQKAATLGSKLLGKRTTLGALPWPASAWSGARDVPVPPKETFRQWWNRTKGGTA